MVKTAACKVLILLLLIGIHKLFRRTCFDCCSDEKWNICSNAQTTGIYLAYFDYSSKHLIEWSITGVKVSMLLCMLRRSRQSCHFFTQDMLYSIFMVKDRGSVSNQVVDLRHRDASQHYTAAFRCKPAVIFVLQYQHTWYSCNHNISQLLWKLMQAALPVPTPFPCTMKSNLYLYL